MGLEQGSMRVNLLTLNVLFIRLGRDVRSEVDGGSTEEDIEDEDSKDKLQE